MTNEFWTYMIDGVVSDSEFNTKEEAQEGADESFYYECIGDDLLFKLERGVQLVKSKRTDFGDQILLNVIQSKVFFTKEDYIQENIAPDVF